MLRAKHVLTHGWKVRILFTEGSDAASSLKKSHNFILILANGFVWSRLQRVAACGYREVISIPLLIGQTSGNSYVIVNVAHCRQ
jgi:hypothetical protein